MNLQQKNLNYNITEYLVFCKTVRLVPTIVVIPFEIHHDVQEVLLVKDEVAGIVVNNSNYKSISYANFNPLIGNIDTSAHSTFKLPNVKALSIVYLGSRNHINYGMLKEAVKQRIYWFIHGLPGAWRKEHVLIFILRKIRARLFLQLNSVARKVSSYVPLYGQIQRLFYSLLSKTMEERRFPNIMQIAEKGLLEREEFVPGRVIIVNTALAWGGAERQLVNTLNGLMRHGIHDVYLVCERLNESADHQFFKEQLPDMSIHCLDTLADINAFGLSAIQLKKLWFSISLLSPLIRDSVLHFVIEFLHRRPTVVHAWQDSTSINAGIAAVIVGVPRIVLSGRNMAPIHFKYHLGYMRSAYRFLATMPSITMLNNSESGARDYTKWLGLAPDRISVIYNGFDSNVIFRADKASVHAYKKKIGIPAYALIVGAIFRFYEEKDPLLWVKTVARVAHQRPDVWFLLIGTGIMKEKINKLAVSLGISKKLLMPGTEENPALPLSAMDIFLLTSKYEGTPNVLIEAQAIGVPVVTTEAGGVIDTIDVGKTGYVVKKRSAKLLADKVVQVLNDEGWRKKVHTEGPVFSRARFDLARMVQKTIEIYGDFR